MNVSVERYQRRKYMSQENSPMLYYVRQKSGTVRVMDVEKLADAIEANSSLTAGDVKHAIEAFVEQLRLSLTQGDKVKIDGLGTFHITLCSEGTEKEKDCTVRSIRRVNVRFVADKALHLVNATTPVHEVKTTWNSYWQAKVTRKAKMPEEEEEILEAKRKLRTRQFNRRYHIEPTLTYNSPPLSIIHLKNAR